MQKRIKAIFPIVTYDINEYHKHMGGFSSHYIFQTKTVKGLYYNGMIWLRHPSPLVLLHEFGHHIFNSIGNDGGGTRLFFDLLDVVFEVVYGFIRYSNWRKGKNFWIGITLIHDNMEDWLDWMFCRN